MTVSPGARRGTSSASVASTDAAGTITTDHAGRGQLGDEVRERGGAGVECAVGDQPLDRRRGACVADDGVAVLTPAAGHVRAHAAETDQPYVHPALPPLGRATGAPTRAGTSLCVHWKVGVVRSC